MKRKRFLSGSNVAFLVIAILTCALLAAPVQSFSTKLQLPQGARQLVRGGGITEWPSKAKRWALVIGVDHYRDENISPLRGANNDAHTLAAALVRYAGFPADQVILLASDQSEGRQPTRINILTYLSNLASTVPKDGLLLVSFAGHGIERARQAYLIPSDARLTDDVSLLEESAVSVTRMHNRISATGVGQVVILLDACRNDPGGRADAPNPLTVAYTRGFDFDVRNHEVNAFVTIYATAVGERAYEYADKKQGYFTWSLVEGLKGGAANENGEVTLANLVKYVQENVPKHVTIDLGAGKQQRPFYRMEGYKAEQLVIAVGDPASATVASRPSTPTVDPVAIELSFWESVKTSTDAEDFKAYLEKYPEGQFAILARSKLRQLDATRGNSSNGKMEEGNSGTNPKREVPGAKATEPLDGTGTSNLEKVFAVRHWTLSHFHAGRLMVSPTGVRWEEEGSGVDVKDNFAASCAEIKSLKQGNVFNNAWSNDFYLSLPKRRYRFDTKSSADAKAIMKFIEGLCGKH
ncbi:MAG TPA: caspase family protein [Pyrinomonadaceae bacterium]|nr:caspase family protein [Pyrinomonadaceae bacterium]